MNRPNHLPDEVQIQALFDAYCSGVISDAQVLELESYIRSDEATRRQFVAYFYLHTELRFAALAGPVPDLVPGEVGPRPERLDTGWWRRWVVTRRRTNPWPIAVWACVLIVLGSVAPSGNRCALFKAEAPEQHLFTKSLWGASSRAGTCRRALVFGRCHAIRATSFVGLDPPVAS